MLGRILYYVPYCSPIHPGRVLTTFGFLSTIVEIFNAIGVAYATNVALPSRLIQVGNAMMKASLILQIIVILLFYLLAAIFHFRCVKARVNTSNVNNSLVTLYISSALIFIRTIYRTVEFFGGENLASVHSASDLINLSPILRYEWFFWVFEATVMALNVLLWNQRHPRRFLPRSYRVYLAKDGVTEVEGPGWNQNSGMSGFMKTLIDPFGMLDLAKRGGKSEPAFWEMDGIGQNQGNQPKDANLVHAAGGERGEA